MSEFGALTRLVPQLSHTTLLCLGDAMIDRYVYGTVERMSPEAPIPVISVTREVAMLGGAGNVARNAAALGGDIRLVAVVGDDDAGHELTGLVSNEIPIEPSLVAVSGRHTTQKTRYIAGTQQLLRADHEETSPLSEDNARRVLMAFEGELAEANAVVLSDYAKGVLCEGVLRPAIAAAQAKGIPIIADPKARDFGRYDGVSLITPNAKELAIATGLPVATDEEAAAAARAVLDRTRIGAVLVTRSERGMTLVARDEAPLHLPAEAREVFDVSGAGDTVLAVLGLALGSGATLIEAARLANAAAGLVVAKLGTAVIYPEELVAGLQAAGIRGAEAKIKTLLPMMDSVARWRIKGARIGFTNGCFDLLHPGHVSLLAEARAQCDRLVVGLNSDASVQRLKGPERPVNSELARAIVLASLESVDLVVIFEEDTPMNLIETLRPDVLIKGADYTIDKVVGANFVQSYGGRVHLAQIKAGHSTTGTIARLVKGA
ncbi:MAG: D-glycero-beta-D-manno-heptose-7-phosphate kinase [Alphaproteobacteria bacterium]|nr:D-glycero-beta-D-manno-heptose-7-phosphate kinase [Alphaproteobacteria bacterium]